METLIAVPRWVLFFGITNLILTAVNVVLLVSIARRVGARFVDELVRRGIGEVRAQGAPVAVVPPRELIDVPGPFIAPRAASAGEIAAKTWGSIGGAPRAAVEPFEPVCHCANPDRVHASDYCGNCGGDL